MENSSTPDVALVPADKIKKLLQLKELVAEMVDDCAIGTFGVRNDNGADEYACPACYATQKVQGYAGFRSSISEVDEHDKDCGFKKLQALLNELED